MGLEFESPASHQKRGIPIRVFLFFIVEVLEIRKIQCDADERRRRRLDGGEHLFSPKAKMQTNLQRVSVRRKTGDSKDQIAACRWPAADTSANTGGYLYFLSLLRKKMQTNLQRGSDGSAAGGGKSDLSEWPRSVCNEVVHDETHTGHRNRGHLANAACGIGHLRLPQPVRGLVSQ